MAEAYTQSPLVPSEPTKRCTKCDTVKSVDAFRRVKKGKYLSSHCRVCEKEYNAAYHKDVYGPNNRERLRDYKAEKAREYYAADPTKQREASRTYRAEHREETNAAGREWYAAHPGYHRVAYQKLKERHPTYGVTAQAKRRAIVRNAPVNDYTDAEWNRTLEYFQNRCGYCLGPLDPPSREHMLPLIRGGSHTDANVIPCCLRCNSRKGDKTLAEYLLLG